ncbi:hypothetical protein LG101_13460 [Levilactobacillus brevis]|nr:hypothetical protein LG101_13840 [Levilactobacillus brevis]OOV21123.1 hypothetical protein LG101_13460 [Levilactobacillus brevis]
MGHTVHSLSIGFRRLDCSTGQYALFSLFYKKGVDGFYPSTPNIIEPFLSPMALSISPIL